MTTVKTDLDLPAASKVPFTPRPSIAASDVQTAIEKGGGGGGGDLAAHEAAADPHPQYTTAAEAAAAAATAAEAAVSAHEAAADPHTQYTTAAEAAAIASVHAATLAALRALAIPTAGAAQFMCYCAGRLARADGYEGFFEWASGDQSANVSADSYGGIWVAPNSATTGASGAWRRIVLDGVYRSSWFGDPASTDHAPHIQAAVNAAPSGSTVDTGPTRVKIATSIAISRDNIKLNSIYEITAASALNAYVVYPSPGDQALTLSGASTIPAGSTSITVTSASGVAAGDMIIMYSDDLLASTTYKKGEIAFVRSVASNTITFRSATLHNLTTNVLVYRVRPVRNFTAVLDATSAVASNILHNGIVLSRVVDAKVTARGLNIYNTMVALIAVFNSHIEYAGGNPGATTNNGFDYGVVLGNACSNNKVVGNGHNLRHVITCGATDLTGRNNSLDGRGFECKDAVVDSHPGFVDVDIVFQSIGNRNGGTPASQPNGCTVQCGGLVRVRGTCDGYDTAAVLIQPFQNTNDSFIIDVTCDNPGASAVRGISFDIQKQGGVIDLIDLAITGAEAPGSGGWGIGLTTAWAYAALDVKQFVIRNCRASGAQYAIGIQTSASNTFRHIAFRGNNVEATTHKIVINNPGSIEKITLEGNTIVGVDNSQKGFWLVGTGGTTAEVRATGNTFEGVAGNTSAIAIHCQQAPTVGIGASNRFAKFVAGTSPNFGDYRPAFQATAGDYRTNP